MILPVILSTTSRRAFLKITFPPGFISPSKERCLAYKLPTEGSPYILRGCQGPLVQQCVSMYRPLDICNPMCVCLTAIPVKRHLCAIDLTALQCRPTCRKSDKLDWMYQGGMVAKSTDPK